ncbi:response regulator transcription factor [Oceanicella actignis]|uniref:DNA-binding response regulator, OmpR family, contains REC and winged-helix (WHTH) domain n=1 Tax=Oceanicella actignis TaxID=1189325 RepID=A0A1M7TKR0_9RHOB|nr:response regulator transcription factor [Oceanicella actignis]SET68725.1 DNA-binding response regulator, OmpR family, contains REC and winged-helix (wHTH) domain [Oceanicella actignis]SHN71324.1 DNA-binding response regulator, OmpR family, contains REC and winged-helix (wHTH) domain [Oceanicella actignis]
MTDAPLIAVLDDEPEVLEILRGALEGAGLRMRGFSTAASFEHALPRLRPALCLVDLGLPDKDGLALVYKLAQEQGALVMIVSGRRGVQDKVAGLELGADDYIVKPFDPAEVVARIRVLLRRGERAASPGRRSRARFGGWSVDFDGHALTAPNGAEARLSRAEGEILRLFLETPNRLLSRAQIQDRIGGGAGEGFDRAIDVRVSRLRTKLGDDPKNPKLIRTIYGAGYIFVGDVTWEG